MASPASAPLLNTTIWRHHIDGRSRNGSHPRCSKFNRSVVNVEVQNGFTLISVCFIIALVHGVKLPSLSANGRFARGRCFA